MYIKGGSYCDGTFTVEDNIYAKDIRNGLSDSYQYNYTDTQKRFFDIKEKASDDTAPQTLAWKDQEEGIVQIDTPNQDQSITTISGDHRKNYLPKYASNNLNLMMPADIREVFVNVNTSGEAVGNGDLDAEGNPTDTPDEKLKPAKTVRRLYVGSFDKTKAYTGKGELRSFISKYADEKDGNNFSLSEDAVGMSTDVRLTGNVTGPDVDDNFIRYFGEHTLSGFANIHNEYSNDFADIIPFNGDIALQPGKAYARDKEGNIKLGEKGEACLGICSDTFGFSTGEKKGEGLPIAVAGFALAYVDKEYPYGTPLMCGEMGVLTKMSLLKRILHPECLIGFYDKKELSKTWKKIEVHNRSWIRV